MTDFLGIDIVGEEIIAAAMAKLPGEVADQGVEEANRYVLDTMRTYAQYNYVGRDRVPWASEKQRRYVMMQISKGNIKVPCGRTQNLRKNWKLVGEGRNQIVANETPYAGFVMGEGMQGRRHNIMGWETETTRIKTRMDRILDRFNQGVRKAIAKLGL